MNQYPDFDQKLYDDSFAVGKNMPLPLFLNAITGYYIP